MEGDTSGGVRIMSRRMVRPLRPPPTANGNGGCHHRKNEEEMDHRRHPKGHPPAQATCVHGDALVDALASSFALALGRFYPFAGRLAAEEHEDGTVTLSLRCIGEGAELVHAAAPEATAADIAASLHVPPVVAALCPLNHVLGADAAMDQSLPLVAAQVTELTDGGVFIDMSMNHSAGDGAAFWHLFNAWSEIHRGGELRELSTPAPVFRRWFIETSPVPVPMPFGKLEQVARRPFERAAAEARESFFTFSAASVEKLRARAKAEMVAGGGGGTISSVEAVLAHLWRAVCRARRLPPEQSTFYTLVSGCRGRVDGIPPGYVGNAMVFGKAEATAGEVQEKGLGWTAWLLNRAAASAFDEAGMRASLARWVREPEFTYNMGGLSPPGAAAAALVSGVRDLAALDVFGNDFGWGKPVAVRSGAGNKADGKVAVFEGPERGGSVSLEVCIAPDALDRLVADQDFMDAVTSAPA
ncbi:hypothetical protein EJB05_10203, partial [Eragrostis curvula]